VLLLAALVVTGCGRPSGSDSVPDARTDVPDAWVRFTPLGFDHLRATRLPAAVVVRERLDEAVARLATEASLTLTPAEAGALAGRPAGTVSEGGLPTLLRAVRHGAAPGGEHAEDLLEVLWWDGAVAVRNDGSREYHEGDPQPWGLVQKRIAVVAWLPAAPSAVFVEDMTVYTGGVDVPGE
jgi:hypothetical protein